MTCDCAECCALAEELRANAEALSGLRDEPLPPLVVRIPRRRPASPWFAAAAAAVLLAVAVTPHRPPPPPRTRVTEQIKIKMLTPDPDVVIYWLIDPKEDPKEGD